MSDRDRESALRRLQETARAKVLTSGILQEVETSAKDRIRDIAERNGAGLSFLQPLPQQGQ